MFFFCLFLKVFYGNRSSASYDELSHLYLYTEKTKMCKWCERVCVVVNSDKSYIAAVAITDEKKAMDFAAKYSTVHPIFGSVRNYVFLCNKKKLENDENESQFRCHKRPLDLNYKRHLALFQ